MENTIKLLDIIGKLWPLVITIFAIVVFLIKWKAIWNAVGNLRKVKIKSPGGEFELTATKEEKVQPERAAYQQTMINVEPKIEEPEHSLDDAFELLIKGQFEEAERIYSDIQRETPEEKRIENSIYYNYYRFKIGIPSAIEAIAKILEGDRLVDHDKYIGYFFLGLCYKIGKRKDLAVRSFNSANQYSKTENERIIVTINIARTLSENEDIQNAISLLIEIFSELKEKESKIQLLKELAYQYKLNEDSIMQIGCLELAAELAINDTTILFDLAYAYSGSKYEEAGIFQYSNLLYFNPDEPGALNNIGVGYKQKGLPISAVEYYKKAIDKDNSLAAGNLAHLYIEGGFENEARDLIEKFRTQQEVDPMLMSAHKSLLTALKRENELKKDIHDIGFRHSNFFRDYASFSLSLNPENYSETNWRDERDNNVNITINNEDLVIEWRTKNEILNDEDCFQIYGKISHGCAITFDCPKTISSGLFSSLYTIDSSTIHKPYRIVEKYPGYCSLNLDKGIIRVLYLKDKEAVIKEFKNVPNA